MVYNNTTYISQSRTVVQNIHRTDNTYINNITINGVGDWGMVRGQTSHTDAASAQTEIDLLRSLAQARGAAIQ